MSAARSESMALLRREWPHDVAVRPLILVSTRSTHNAGSLGGRPQRVHKKNPRPAGRGVLLAAGGGSAMTADAAHTVPAGVRCQRLRTRQDATAATVESLGALLPSGSVRLRAGARRCAAPRARLLRLRLDSGPGLGRGRRRRMLSGRGGRIGPLNASLDTGAPLWGSTAQDGQQPRAWVPCDPPRGVASDPGFARPGAIATC